MAGATREARAAGERLPDRISIGVLARTFTDELIDEVIDEAGVREKRFRLLPARLMVLFTLACWLFTRTGYVGVLAKLADAHLIEGARGWSMPGTEAIGRARERLGPAPLRLLFAKVAGPLGSPQTPGVFYAGLRVATIDGFTLDVKNTPQNLAHQPGPQTTRTLLTPSPQTRRLAPLPETSRSHPRRPHRHPHHHDPPTPTPQNLNHGHCHPPHLKCEEPSILGLPYSLGQTRVPRPQNSA